MKKQLFIITIFILIFKSSGFAQGIEESQEELLKHNSKIKEHALKIKYGESRTHKEHVKNTEVIGKHLDSAMTEHQILKKRIPKKYRESVQKHNASVEKQHAEAKKHHEALSNELNKEKHNEMIVRHHATRIHASLEKVEKEEGIIKAKTERQ